MVPWQWIALAAAAAAGLAAVAVLLWLRRRGWYLVGPMFWYELVRLARRGQQPRLRALLVGLLLVGLFITYLREFPGEELAALTGGTQLSINRSSHFANTFLIAFMSAQLLAVILITPALVGSAITEEKERGTLDFLRSSMLSNREIVLGKFAARLAFVGGVVLAGVPVLALTSLFGGVALSQLLAGYWITAVTAVSLGAFSLFLGVKREGLRDVLLWVYSLTAVLSVFGSCCGCIPGIAGVSPPSAMLWMLAWEDQYGNPDEPIFWVNLGVLTTLHGLAAMVFTVLAVLGVRSAPPVRRAPPRRRYRPRRLVPVARPVGPPPAEKPPPLPPMPPPTRRYDDPDEDADDYRYRPIARRSFRPGRIGDGDPFLWKERYFAGGLRLTEGGFLTGCAIAAASMTAFVLGMILFFAAISELNRGRWIGEAVNPVARLFLTGSAMLLGLGLGARAAGAVAGERQKQTLDALLSVPVERSVILRAKWLAPVVWARWPLIVTGVGAVLALLTGGVHPIGFVSGVLQLAGWLAFANTLGLWLSVRHRTVTRATVHFLVWVLVLWFAPLVLTPLALAVGGDGGEVVTGFSLPVGVWQALFSWTEFGERVSGPGEQLWTATRAAGAMAGAAYLLAAGLLWLDAARRFGREGK